MPLHPVVREMFTHYIGNDVYSINLIIGSADPQAVSLENIEKIINHTRGIKDFLGRLREATVPT